MPPTTASGSTPAPISGINGDADHPEHDPNEAYEVAPMTVEPHGPPADWWTVTCNGIPVYHFGPANLWDAERYCVDPIYRLSRETKYIHS